MQTPAIIDAASGRGGFSSSFSQPIADVQPQVDASNVLITSIGTTAIAGTPPTQYQIWVGAHDGSTDHMALDFFIGQQVNYLHQFQFSLFASDEELGALKLEEVVRLYDFDDQNIVVGPPANAIERPAMAGLSTPVINGGLLSTLAAPLATAELRALVVERIAR